MKVMPSKQRVTTIDQLATVVEKHAQMTDRRIDELAKIVQKQGVQFNKGLKEQGDALSESVDNLATITKAQFDRVGEKIDKLDSRLDSVESDTAQILPKLTRVEKNTEFNKENLVFKIDHEDLRSRVGVVESKLKIHSKV